MLKAWERELAWIKAGKPVVLTEGQEDAWLHYVETGSEYDKKLLKDWISEVPGSKAPCHLVVGAIQAMYNRGYDVAEAESLIDAGLEAAEKKDICELQKITAKIYYLLNSAKKIPNNTYDSFTKYRTWEQIEKAVDFPKAINIDVNSEKFAEDIRTGWTAQLIGSALGTQVEGYTYENIKSVYGEVRDYLREPETYNDDITYEIAFLEVFFRKGYDVTSDDIAFEWLSLVPDGYSAEEVAISNLRRGIFPPQSGVLNNYYSDWIGVQMRTNIHGMVAPGNPKLAAELSVRDGVVSHSNNGILGGMFNAVLTSLSFVEKNARILIEKTINCIPRDSEYYSVATFAHDVCKQHSDWESAWKKCEEKYKEYHWIHCYLNVCAEIIALYFGNGDFDETAYIICMEGMDADCTAAPILNALGIMVGKEKIQSKWALPLNERVLTYLRKYNDFSFTELCEKTVKSVQKACAKRMSE